MGSLKPGQALGLTERHPVWGSIVTLSARRLADGCLLIIANAHAPQSQAIEVYARRWAIKTLFCGLKPEASGCEDTYHVHAEHLR